MHGNVDVNYEAGDIALSTTINEKDLGVTLSTGMNVSEQPVWYCSFKQ